ncbi:MAG TPA: oligosaccharide flippase family protein [Rhizomicrobium sp.]|jgi:O-antigen/teichoic acid export membrane protein
MARAAIRDVGKLISGNLLAKVFGVASLMFFTRILSKQEVAIFPVYLMLIGIASLFFSFGIYQTFLRRLPSLIREDITTARSLVMTGTAIIMVGIVTVLIVSLAFSERIAVFAFRDEKLSWAVRVMSAGFVAYAVARVADNIMWGRGQFAAMSALQIADSIVRPAATVTSFLLFGFPGIVYGLVVAQIINAGLLFYCVADLFFGRLPPLYPVKKLMSESLPFYIDGYLWYLKGEGDSLLVTVLLGPAILAEYYVAKTLYTNAMLVLTSLDRVALERLARHAGLTDVFRAKAREMQVHIAETMIPLSLWAIAVAGYGMVVLAGSRYRDATWPAVGLLVVALVQFLFVTVDRAVFVSLSGAYRLAKTAVEAAAVLIAAVYFVREWGLMGVVEARVLGPLAAGLFGIALLRRKLGLSLPFEPALRATVAALPGTLLVFLFAPKMQGTVSALLAGIVSSAVWAFSFTVFSFAMDRTFFYRILNGIRESLAHEKLEAGGVAG